MKSLRIALFACLLPLVARAQDNWRSFPQDVTTANLWSVAYAPDTRVLVAVGEQGTVLTYSYDFDAWLPRESGQSGWLVGVGYGAGRFVVVGDGGVILTSDNAGETWTPRVSGTTTRLNAAAYGDGRWLVVGEQGTVLTSTDGTTWTARPALGANFLRGLAYGQGRFVIGGGNGTLYTTTDAVTFTAVPIATTADIEGVAIAASRFWVSGRRGLFATGTTLGTWTFSPVTSEAQIYRGMALHNLDEAVAAGDRHSVLWSRNVWLGPFNQPQLFAVAATQARNEIVAVGFNGLVSRTPEQSIPLMLADSGRNAIYGTDVRIAFFFGPTPLGPFQWYYDSNEDTPIPSATGPELFLPRVTAADARRYGLRYGNTTGSSAIHGASPLAAVVPAGRPEVRDTNFVAAVPDPALVVAQPDGKLLVTGTFSVGTDGGATYGFARLNVDGSLDRSFRLGEGVAPPRSISAVRVLPDSRIYVLGSFTTLAGIPRRNLARLLSDGSVDLNFDPDPAVALTKMFPLPDGRVVVQGSLAGVKVILRLAANGTRDGTFAPISDHELVNIDAQGRVLAQTSSSPQMLVRYRADGSRDSSYTETLARNFALQTPLGQTHVTERGFYAVTFNRGLAGTFYSFGRFKPDGGPDPSYLVPPQSSYPSGLFSWHYLPDGSLVIVRGLNGKYDVEFYDPDGRPDRTRYATARDQAYTAVVASAPDGSLLARATTDFRADLQGLVRLRPITGRVGRLRNLSVRSFVDPAGDPLILGLVTSGSGTTRALIRAIGPGLANYQVADAMPDPQLRLVRDGATLTSNDQWPAALGPRFPLVGAFPLDAGSRDAALESDVGAGSYTAIVTPVSGSAAGTTLAELYESADDPAAPRRFINASARGRVTAERPLIVGFSIAGDVPVTVLIRAVGPELRSHGVANFNPNPKLMLHRAGDGAALWENDNWSSTELGTVQAKVGAFSFINGSQDAAMLVTLPPGTYSAVATGVNGASGTALVEVYEVP